MKRFNIQLLSIAIVGISLMSSCNLYPDDDARIDEFDAVITYHDKTIDFGDYKTYAIVDSVREISASKNDSKSDPILNSQYIIDLINTNMQARNYDKVENPSDADLIINAGALTSTTTVISGGGYGNYYYGYPGGYYGPGYWWGYPGYGYYYPWYPISYVTEYEIGTLIIDMVDQKNFDPEVNDQLLIKWSGVVRGVLGLTNNADIRNRLRIDINQAFTQSPYLKSNL